MSVSDVVAIETSPVDSAILYKIRTNEKETGASSVAPPPISQSFAQMWSQIHILFSLRDKIQIDLI